MLLFVKWLSSSCQTKNAAASHFIFRDGAICEVSTAHLKSDTLVQVITLRSVWDGVSEYD